MRIRSIKPEFWRSDDIDALDIPDRLLFIGLWSYVDDSGVGIDKEAAIAADLFAGDLSRDPHECSVRVHGGLKHLSAAGLITRYEVDGRRFLHITKWSLHQKINRPSESRYPPPTCGNAVIHGTLSEPSVSPQADSPFGTGEQGNRGTGEKTRSPASRPTATDRIKPRIKPGTDDTDPDWCQFWAAYPRKVSKGAARKAWTAAVKHSDPAAIIAAAEQYRDHVAGTDPKFIPHPATWLNGERWADEAAPRTPTGHQPFRNPPDISAYHGAL